LFLPDHRTGLAKERTGNPDAWNNADQNLRGNAKPAQSRPAKRDKCPISGRPAGSVPNWNRIARGGLRLVNKQAG
jgi:hypothetical protein